MEILEALDLTFQHAQQVIGNVRPDQLDDKTPCHEWGACRDLLFEHQIGVVAGPRCRGIRAASSRVHARRGPAARFAE